MHEIYIDTQFYNGHKQITMSQNNIIYKTEYVSEGTFVYCNYNL